MKLFRILLALACCFALVFVLASCGDNGTDVNTDSSADSETEQDTSKDTGTSTDKVPDTNVGDEPNGSENDEPSGGENDEPSGGDNDEPSGGDDEGPTEVELWQSQADEAVIAQAEKLLESKHRLEYNEDGSFRVMILADVHMTTNSDSSKILAVGERVKALVDEIQPNLVILTGDNTIDSYSEARLRENIYAIVSYIEEKQIPWCHVYGNHDHESALSKEEQQKIYESYKYCISKDVAELSGTGTYVHGVYNKDGSLGSLVWLIDSGAYDTVNGGYDYIKDDQIEWYKQTSLLIKEYNNGSEVKGMMAFHIPLIENRTADSSKGDENVVYEYQGSVNEAMCPSYTDTNLLETIFELGDVKLIVTGHDHTNDYMFNYKGVKLSSSPNISDLTYFNATYQGSRVIDLNASTIDNIPTRVEYLIKRLSPDDFDYIEDDVVIEDFEGEIADPVISGWATEGLRGTVTVEKAEGKGRDGSDALEVKRDDVANFEFVLDISSAGKVGNNEYIVVWMDFTNVEFRKACVGFASIDSYENPYRMDDNDGTNPKFYYLADGASEWVELSHGGDGCFGWDQGGRVIGYKGYFAFKIDDLRQGARRPTEDTVVTGFYFYGSLWWGEEYLNKPFYIDNIILCQDYKEIELP